MDFLDINYYRAVNPDLANLDDSQAYKHFLTFGLAEGRAFSPYVDLDYYRARYADLVNLSSEQLLNHLEMFGLKEGRSFSPLVDLTYYKLANEDLTTFSNEQLFDHLTEFGLAEGRPFSPILEYISISFLEPNHWLETYMLDANGVPMVDYRGSIGLQYNPTTIAQFALSSYDEYVISKENKYLQYFNDQVSYLKSNFVELSDKTIGYPYNFYLADYDLAPPWYSGLAQGQIVSVLVRSYFLTSNPELLDLIQKTLNLMVQPKEEGGLLTHTPEGGVWIEEYPSQNPSLVLNGFVFAIFGLADYLSIFHKHEAIGNLYEDSLISLKESIKYYDTGDWLKYSRYSDTLVSEHYMNFQILQMEQLFRLTSDPLFQETAERWKSYLDLEKQ